MAQPITDSTALVNTNVLLVDDDPAILRILSTWLEKAGYRVRRAGDGELALAAIEAECPDFLVTDWQMPNVNGLELCRRVRQLKLPHYIYILFLSVKSTAAEMIEGLEVGADDFLSKPVYRGELLARLKSGSRVLQLEHRLSQMARTDPLTGLMTRRTFLEVLEKEWQRSKRFHLPLSCVMLDLDFFKRVNDIHGHPAGDSILKAVAALLSDCSRGGDSVCRYGDEEFCAMLPETSEHDAAVWAERVRHRLSSIAILSGGREIRITASFGSTGRHDDTQTATQLVDEAEQALACAKQWGHDRVVRYEMLDEQDDLDLEETDKHGGMFQGITARHVMTPLVTCLREDQTVGEAAEFLLRSRINSTPVINAQGQLVGIVSERDLLGTMVSRDCWNSPVREVMKPNVTCYEEDTPIRTIYKFICRVSIRRVVIVSQGRPTGTISRRTLLRWFANLAVSKGLREDQPTPPAAEALDPGRDQPSVGARQRLAETARQLVHRASELQRHFQEDTDDLTSCVVGGAAGVQELVDDLLAYCHSASSVAGTAGERKPVRLDGIRAP
jgi:two-component system cell cycle response regulator